MKSKRSTLNMAVIAAILVCAGLFVSSRYMYYKIAWSGAHLYESVITFGDRCMVGVSDIPKGASWQDLAKRDTSMRKLGMPYRNQPQQEKPEVKLGQYLLTRCELPTAKIDRNSAFAWMRLHAVFGDAAIFLDDNLVQTVSDYGDAEFPMPTGDALPTMLTIVAKQTTQGRGVGLPTGMPLFITDSRESLAAINLHSNYHYVLRPIYWINYCLVLLMVFAVAWLGGIRHHSIGWIILALAADAVLMATIFNPQNVVSGGPFVFDSVVYVSRNLFLALAAFFCLQPVKRPLVFSCFAVTVTLITLVMFNYPPEFLTWEWRFRGLFRLQNATMFSFVFLVGLIGVMAKRSPLTSWNVSVTGFAFLLAAGEVAGLTVLRQSNFPLATLTMEIAMTGFCVLLIFDLVIWQRRFAAERTKREFVERKQAWASAYSRAMRSLAHDLRAPIAKIERFLHELQSPKSNQRLNVLQDALKKDLSINILRIQSMMDEMAKDRPDALELSLISLQELLNEVTHEIAPEVMQNECPPCFKVTCDENLWINADRAKLKRALINLLQNAIHASRQQQEVWISVTNQPDCHRVKIAIGNSGSYIPPSLRDKIFQDGFSTKGKNGAGFGLAFVKQIAESHEGSVVCRSDPLKGTEFILELPQATSPLSQERSLKLCKSKKPLVTLVEDSVFMQEVWRDALSNSAELLCFESPDSFSSYLSSSSCKPSLVITDHCFASDATPINRGSEQVFDLVKRHFGDEVPVILCSDYLVTTADAFDAVIPKEPLTLEELERVLR